VAEFWATPVDWKGGKEDREWGGFWFARIWVAVCLFFTILRGGDGGYYELVYIIYIILMFIIIINDMI